MRFFATLFLHIVLLNMVIVSYLRLAGAGANWSILSLFSQQTVLCHSLQLVKQLTNAFTIFPTGTVWLGCLIQSLGAAGSGLGLLGYTHAHVSLRDRLYT
jgi:hypothetical protein